VRFLLRDDVHEIGDIDPTMTLLDWLRLGKGLNGTKEGCAEGDCGACTVVVGRPDGDRVRYAAVNACICFVAMLDGCHVLTVEHLRRPDRRLHPVQQAMVDCHASQCGFCTPGFVMSLFAFYLNEAGANEGRLRDALAGNLCRCTGYAPILAAGRRMFEIGDTAEDALLVTPDILKAKLGERDGADTLMLERAGRRFIAPRTADALAELLDANPGATIVSGATDVGLWVTKALRLLDTVVYVGAVEEMRRVQETAATVEIGAAATFAEAEPVLTRYYPDFGELIRRIGGAQVRNVGTMGGNIANGSPIGDSPPALIAIGATLILRQGAERRRVPIEDFFLSYGQQDRRPGEFIERISVPKPAPGAAFRAYKISKRFDQDISSLCGAFLVELSDGIVTRARIAFGGMAGTPRRAPAAEAALQGQAWTMPGVIHAMECLDGDFAPLDDWRASSAYRRTVAGNLLMKFFVETTSLSVDTRLVGRESAVHA
jgi:xanthine dehydrogenase small subunit